MTKIGEMNLTLNAKAAEGIMSVKRENQELKVQLERANARIDEQDATISTLHDQLEDDGASRVIAERKATELREQLDRATEPRADGECQAQRARAAELRVAELEGAREHDHETYRRNQSSMSHELGRLRGQVAELEGERDTERDRRLRTATYRDRANESLFASESQVKDLQAQLDRANQQIESYRKAGMAQHRRNSDRATEPVEHSNMPAADARRLVIEADYKHQNSGPLDLVDTQIALTAAKCLIAELDRATEQAQALKESTASALQVLKDDRDVLYRELRESQDVDRATEPRPMSEAPRDGTWFTASIDVAYDSGRACWEDTGGFIVELRRADGWLPTSSGGEVR